MRTTLKVIARRLAMITLAVFVFWPIHADTKGEERAAENPYAKYVWPPPPNEARIGLELILSHRNDVEVKKKGLRKFFVGTEPQGQYDELAKPVDATFDNQGRVLVSDWAKKAVFRFDPEGRRLDVFGVRSTVALKEPMGLTVGSDDTIFVADTGNEKVLAFSVDGELVAQYGKEGDLTNPTDVALSNDGSTLYVVDSRAHQIVVFDVKSGAKKGTIGKKGSGEAEFFFPCAATVGPEGNLWVVDQLNSRIQVLDGDGEFLDEFGGLGTAFGDFVRPKDVAVDQSGLIYVVDYAFNNIQIFDIDFTLLTFIGEGGGDPGRFRGPTGISVSGKRFVAVDQLNARVQVFGFLDSTGGE